MLKEQPSPVSPLRTYVPKNSMGRSGVKFDLVDLSKRFGAKLRARLKGVRQTPALLHVDNPSRLYVGLTEISQYITESQALKEN